MGRIQNHESKKMNTPNNSRKKRKLDLPWWVELLFVQIGLPDKWLVYFLKTNKNLREIFKNEKSWKDLIE